MTASENKEIVRKLRRVAEGNPPAWAVLHIGMDEIADLLLPGTGGLIAHVHCPDGGGAP